MRMLMLTDFLLLVALCGRLAALHDEVETSLCRSESGETEARLDMRQIISSCFGDAFSATLPNIEICNDQGRLHCQAIRSVFTIIPSCHYCNHLGLTSETENCYIKQKEQTQCSVNNLLNKIRCVKIKGQCERKIFQSSSQSFDDVTTLEQTTVDIEEETTVATSYAEEEASGNKGYYNYDKKRCEPCKDCSQSEELTGVSLGVAIGLLFVGIIIGTIVTAVICICVGSRRNILKGKTTENFQKPKSQEHTTQAQQETDPAVPDSTLPVETSINYPVQPTAPIRSGSSQARYHTLGTVSNSRDSHTYTGLQEDSPEYSEPIGGENRYQTPNIQPIRGANTVVSPVYSEFTDNIISSTGEQRANQNPVAESQPIRNTDTNDLANHNYFVLESQNEARNGGVSGNVRPVSDHQYFVLEEQNGQQHSKDNDTTDLNYHEYFVLEKGQT